MTTEDILNTLIGEGVISTEGDKYSFNDVVLTENGLADLYETAPNSEVWPEIEAAHTALVGDDTTDEDQTILTVLATHPTYSIDGETQAITILGNTYPDDTSLLAAVEADYVLRNDMLDGLEGAEAYVVTQPKVTLDLTAEEREMLVSKFGMTEEEITNIQSTLQEADTPNEKVEEDEDSLPKVKDETGSDMSGWGNVSGNAIIIQLPNQAPQVFPSPSWTPVNSVPVKVKTHLDFVTAVRERRLTMMTLRTFAAKRLSQ